MIKLHETFLGEMLTAFLGAMGAETIRDKLKGVGNVVIKDALHKKKITDECMSEMFAFILGELYGRNPAASDSLRNLLSNKKKEGSRSWALAMMYLALSDTPEERATRIRIFELLGKMPEAEFDAAVAVLDRDMIMHYVHEGINAIEQTITEIKDLSKRVGADTALHEADKNIAEKLRGFRKFLNSKGVKR